MYTGKMIKKKKHISLPSLAKKYLKMEKLHRLTNGKCSAALIGRLQVPQNTVRANALCSVLLHHIFAALVLLSQALIRAAKTSFT
jgi:hypothetical protein